MIMHAAKKIAIANKKNAIAKTKNVAVTHVNVKTIMKVVAANDERI